MKPKVIVISVEVYTNKTKNKNLQNDFEKNGYEFEYWYIGNLHLYFGHAQSPLKSATGFKSFKSISEVEKELISLKGDFISIIQFPLNHKTEKILRILHNKAMNIIRIDMNQTISTFGESFNRKDYWMGLLKSPRKLIFNLRTKFALKRLEKNGVLAKIKTFQTGTKYSEEFSITFDDVYTYNRLQKSDNSYLKLPERFIVFVDNSMPDHPDFKAHGVKTIEAKKYYRKINAFFDKIEKSTGIEVIIAAHPKSQHKDEYKHRKIYKGITAELIKSCSAVLNHYSSCIGYTTLFKKPLIYIYTDEFLIRGSFLAGILKKMHFQAEYLNALIINIEHEKPHIPEINIERYNKFIKEYLLAKEYPKTNYEIIENFLQK
uniref:hypothetical protein n=1 Tax=Ornithobacterium rhinotracheale TaxID=28251 RepID=UPI0039A5B7CD